MEREPGFHTTTVTVCKEANLLIVVVVVGFGESTGDVHDPLSIAAGSVAPSVH